MKKLGYRRRQKPILEFGCGYPQRKRPIVLLEVMIALTLVILLVLPWVRAPIRLYRQEMEQLERIANAAGVRPWFFPEWRALYISALMGEVMADSPHLSITALRAMRDGRRGIPQPRR